jgi:uncharacterized protein
MKTLAVRLTPHQDLLASLEKIVQDNHIQAACVLSCAGSLQKAVLRFADQPAGSELLGKFEIVSLSGMLAVAGSHLHIAISDEKGATLGGHLLHGCRVYTTAEIVLGVIENMRFERTPDPQTGYPELVIHQPD